MSAESFLGGRAMLCCGDSIHFMRDQPENRYDSIVCDPPYALVSIVNRFGSDNAAPAKDGIYKRSSSGFMGKKWDTGDSAHDSEFWREALRVLKPGGYVLAFAGTRTYHRLACAIEDAGFEIRDMISYLYGSGFPKSHSVTKGLCDAVCCCKEIPERNLRPVRVSDVPETVNTQDQCREILLAGLSQQSSHGTMPSQNPEERQPRGDEPSMEGRGDIPEAPRQLRERSLRSLPPGIDFNGANGRLRNGASANDGPMGSAQPNADGMRSPSRPQAAKQRANEFRTVAGQPQPQISGAWDNCGRCGKPVVPDGLGTALKPACEPICMARKPLSEGTVAANVLKWGTGAINVDGCRVGSGDDKGIWPITERTDVRGSMVGPMRAKETDILTGRWPANVIHDGSEEVVAGFPNSQAGTDNGERGTGGIWQQSSGIPCGPQYGDSGSASRFFYTAKADSDDRLGSKHPTVKPVDLMQYLVRLVTPKGGLVLDPFAGTGTTAEACFREGMTCAMVEREPEYQADIRRRMALVMGGPEERRRESIKAKKLPIDHGPLFSCG